MSLENWTRPAARWVLPKTSDHQITELQQALRIDRLPAAILVARGYAEPSAAREFLSPDLDSLCDPFLLKDMEAAVTRLLVAVRTREPVLIYGDYDVDGTASIIILKKAIEILGGNAEFHIPHRLTEGYGMRSEVIERAAQAGVRLVVSVDTGIRAGEVVRHANSLGIDVIVTDHHLPEAQLPPALAVLNPNRSDCRYPFKDLCGAGVTFKLVEALLSRSEMLPARRRALLDSFLKPVAIATVADIVPLVGENRVIVRRGLSGLRKVHNVGLRSLLSVAGFDEGECPTAHQVAFRLAPRINAAGRMSTAKDVIELFLTHDADRARSLADHLDRLNRERQQVEAEIVESILAECQEGTFASNSAALVFSGPGWHLGVLGIVASRLVERFCRPVFVLSESAKQSDSNEEASFTGSGRSIPAFHLLQALESMSDLFQRFGGHRQAAGLTLPHRNIDKFRERFHEFASGRLSQEDMRPQYSADAVTSFLELTTGCVEQVLSMGPFGFGNPAPLLYAPDARVASAPRVLREGKHFKVALQQANRTLHAKAWNYGDRVHLLEEDTNLDLLFTLEDDPGSRKRGYGSWCATLKDIRIGQPLIN